MSPISRDAPGKGRILISSRLPPGRVDGHDGGTVLVSAKRITPSCNPPESEPVTFTGHVAVSMPAPARIGSAGTVTLCVSRLVRWTNFVARSVRAAAFGPVA